MGTVNIAGVTIISCLYGDGFTQFVPRWHQAIQNLNQTVDVRLELEDGDCEWIHPEPFYLNRAWMKTISEWIWIVNVDDIVLPDALDGIDDVEADVWLTGFVRDDGVTHISKPLPNADYLASDTNGYAAGSLVRRSALHRVGGFRDVAFQDWDLWRRLAADGATFSSSGRVNYRYSQHPLTRTNLELTADRRSEHLAEMAC